jgi:hypothetical protein
VSPRGTRRARPAIRRLVLFTAAGLAVVVVIAAAFTFAGRRGPAGPVAGPVAVAAPMTATVPSAVAGVPSSGVAPAVPSKEPPRASTTPKPAPTTKAAVKATGHRQVTFVNDERQTIWVAAAQQTAQPALPVTGWVLKAGHSLTIDVPNHWNGRFWGRTGCSFGAAGTGHCATGDCAGRFQCRQFGAIPASLAEFNFNSYMNLDFYDVSLVDGSNLPMWINIAAGKTKDPISGTGCSAAGCTKAVPCPSALKVGGGGCESPCGVFDTDQYCCRGKWAPRDQCQPEEWPVDYAAIFKKAEPFAYSYVDDDATSTFTCAGECGYRITWGTTAE